MTRNDDRKPIRRHHRSDRSRGPRIPRLCGKLSIGIGLPDWNLAGCANNLLLKCRQFRLQQFNIRERIRNSLSESLQTLSQPGKPVGFLQIINSGILLPDGIDQARFRRESAVTPRQNFPASDRSPPPQRRLKSRVFQPIRLGDFPLTLTHGGMPYRIGLSLILPFRRKVLSHSRFWKFLPPVGWRENVPDT